MHDLTSPPGGTSYLSCPESKPCPCMREKQQPRHESAVLTSRHHFFSQRHNHLNRPPESSTQLWDAAHLLPARHLLNPKLSRQRPRAPSSSLLPRSRASTAQLAKFVTQLASLEHQHVLVLPSQDEP